MSYAGANATHAGADAAGRHHRVDPKLDARRLPLHGLPAVAAAPRARARDLRRDPRHEGRLLLPGRRPLVGHFRAHAVRRAHARAAAGRSSLRAGRLRRRGAREHAAGGGRRGRRRNPAALRGRGTAPRRRGRAGQFCRTRIGALPRLRGALRGPARAHSERVAHVGRRLRLGGRRLGDDPARLDGGALRRRRRPRPLPGVGRRRGRRRRRRAYRIPVRELRRGEPRGDRGPARLLVGREPNLVYLSSVAAVLARRKLGDPRAVAPTDREPTTDAARQSLPLGGGNPRPHYAIGHAGHRVVRGSPRCGWWRPAHEAADQSSRPRPAGVAERPRPGRRALAPDGRRGRAVRRGPGGAVPD
mmetsp:Transcript_19919/g.59411  ORF Transcript_19919/g.59411 Transcript_19919/m.59411 type:complete len:359 (-) Transcript_19919:93-1169(-)